MDRNVVGWGRRECVDRIITTSYVEIRKQGQSLKKRKRKYLKRKEKKKSTNCGEISTKGEKWQKNGMRVGSGKKSVWLVGQWYIARVERFFFAGSWLLLLIADQSDSIQFNFNSTEFVG